MKALLNFAKTYQVRLSDVMEFQKIGNRYAEVREHVLNGDPHPLQDWSDAVGNDKNECSRFHQAEAAVLSLELDRLARSMRFDHVDYGVGLYPTLQQTESDTTGTVHFPY